MTDRAATVSQRMNLEIGDDESRFLRNETTSQDMISVSSNFNRIQLPTGMVYSTAAADAKLLEENISKLLASN